LIPDGNSFCPFWKIVTNHQKISISLICLCKGPKISTAMRSNGAPTLYCWSATTVANKLVDRVISILF
jgi:hypothetical protein